MGKILLFTLNKMKRNRRNHLQFSKWQVLYKVLYIIIWKLRFRIMGGIDILFRIFHQEFSYMARDSKIYEGFNFYDFCVNGKR